MLADFEVEEKTCNQNRQNVKSTIKIQIAEQVKE